jgi:hypothetical protein
MKINFHYENHNPLNTNCWIHAMDDLFYGLKTKYPEFEFNKVLWWSRFSENFEPDKHGYYDKFKNSNATSMMLIIENADNGNYFVISYWDKGYYEINSWHDYNEKCLGVFSSNGMHLDDFNYTPAPINYTPTSLMVCSLPTEKVIDELYYNNLKDNNRVIPEKLNFMCLVPYLFRDYLHKNDSRFEIIVNHIDAIKFLEYLNKYNINIDINSVTEPSCRTAQILGLGSVLLRPKLKVKTHNELIADYHYAEVECENLGNYKLLADAYIDKFEKIKNDKEYLNFISKNARKYYEENCTVESHVRIMTDLIDLNKLK